MIAATASLALPLTISVAPSSAASASRVSLTSTAMIREAPTIRAAITAARPTEPMPNTASTFPGSILSAFITAPGAGLDAAGERPEQCQIRILRHFHDIAFMAQGVAGEGGLPENIAVNPLSLA